MMNDANENENDNRSPFFFSLFLSLLFVVCLALAGFFFSRFFLGFSLSTLLSRVCSSLCWTKRRKKKERVFPPSKLSFSLFCCSFSFFVRRDRMTRDGFDERTVRKKNIAKRERKAEEGQTPKRQNEKTRASRRESVAFLGRKGESNVLSLRLFFESWRYVILLPRFYTLARVIESLFAAQEEKAEEFLRAA